ncbi:MAG: hypothetical protein WC658_04120 [Candidatus Omnitrophota bacterium]
MLKLKFLIILIFGFFSLCFADESLTITTYFPSPYGVYNELQLYAHNPAVTTCDDAHKGTLFYKSTDDQVYVCKGATLGWQTVGGGSTPDYDSGWFADNTSSNHTTTLTHSFGSFPSNWSILFSPDNPPSSYVYPVREFNYSWYPNIWSGPSIRMNTTQFQILWYLSSSMLYWFNPVTTTWSAWNTGYIRVKLWK